MFRGCFVRYKNSKIEAVFKKPLSLSPGGPCLAKSLKLQRGEGGRGGTRTHKGLWPAGFQDQFLSHSEHPSISCFGGGGGI